MFLLIIVDWLIKKYIEYEIYIFYMFIFGSIVRFIVVWILWREFYMVRCLIMNGRIYLVFIVVKEKCVELEYLFVKMIVWFYLCFCLKDEKLFFRMEMILFIFFFIWFLKKKCWIFFYILWDCLVFLFRIMYWLNIGGFL